ncbi:MAG: SpoIID/LytB domain-containing protein [Phycisphaerae bacterium]
MATRKRRPVSWVRGGLRSMGPAIRRMHPALRRFGWRLGRRKVVPLVSLAALACIIAAGALSSCYHSDGPSPDRVRPESPAVVRVKLTSHGPDATVATTAGYQVLIDGRQFSQSSSPMPAVTVRRAGGAWRIGNRSGAGQTLEIHVAEGGLVQFDDARYRGHLRLIATGESFIAVNHVDMESYVAGVISKELFPAWSVETYKALAVAARTFARYEAMNFGATAAYDVADDQSSQVYGGQSAETAKSLSAARATAGLMLTYPQGGQDRIFRAQYSSCCGGVVNSADVLKTVALIPPTTGGQHCDDCSDAPHYRWPPVRVSKADVYRAVLQSYPSAASLNGAVTDIRVASTTPYGRMMWLDIIGRNGAESIRLRADDLRLALLHYHGPSGKSASPAAALYSMNCRIRCTGLFVEFYDGRGFGHGVGLCQWGAEGKARKGWAYTQILGFYYPGAKLTPVH